MYIDVFFKSDDFSSKNWKSLCPLSIGAGSTLSFRKQGVKEGTYLSFEVIRYIKKNMDSDLSILLQQIRNLDRM